MTTRAVPLAVQRVHRPSLRFIDWARSHLRPSSSSSSRSCRRSSRARFRPPFCPRLVLGYPVQRGGNLSNIADLDPQIRRMIQRIAERFDPDRIILFGSRARGTARPDSDVDLLVVLPVQGSCRRKAVEIGVSLADRTLPLDLIVVTPEQFERERDQIGSVLRDAAREGRVVHERAA